MCPAIRIDRGQARASALPVSRCIRISAQDGLKRTRPARDHGSSDSPPSHLVLTKIAVKSTSAMPAISGLIASHRLPLDCQPVNRPR